MRSLGALLEVVAVAVGGLVLAPAGVRLLGLSAQDIYGDVSHLVLYLTLESSLTLGIILILLWAGGRRLRDLGWAKQGWWRESFAGVSVVPLLFGATILVGFLFRILLPEYVSETNPLLEMIRDGTDLGLLLFSSVFVGGIKEEVQRAFILVHFRNHLGGAVPGLILWSAFFGAGHSFQGVDFAVAAGVLGLLFGLLYLWRGHLAAPVAAHALYDVVTLLIFWGLLRA